MQLFSKGEVPFFCSAREGAQDPAHATQACECTALHPRSCIFLISSDGVWDIFMSYHRPLVAIQHSHRNTWILEGELLNKWKRCTLQQRHNGALASLLLRKADARVLLRLQGLLRALQGNQLKCGHYKQKTVPLSNDEIFKLSQTELCSHWCHVWPDPLSFY